MSRFVNMTAVDVVTLSNGDQVKVRQALSAEESAMLNKNLVHMEYQVDNDDKGQRTGEMIFKGGEWYLQKIAICRAYLVDWDFKDDGGEPVSYDPALVSQLTEETVNEIAEGIDSLQNARREQFAKKEKKPAAK